MLAPTLHLMKVFKVIRPTFLIFPSPQLTAGHVICLDKKRQVLK